MCTNIFLTILLDDCLRIKFFAAVADKASCWNSETSPHIKPLRAVEELPTPPMHQRVPRLCPWWKVPDTPWRRVLSRYTMQLCRSALTQSERHNGSAMQQPLSTAHVLNHPLWGYQTCLKTMPSLNLSTHCIPHPHILHASTHLILCRISP